MEAAGYSHVTYPDWYLGLAILGLARGFLSAQAGAGPGNRFHCSLGNQKVVVKQDYMRRVGRLCALPQARFVQCIHEHLLEGHQRGKGFTAAQH